MGCSWAAASGVQRAGAYCVATRTACFVIEAGPGVNEPSELIGTSMHAKAEHGVKYLSDIWFRKIQWNIANVCRSKWRVNLIRTAVYTYKIIVSFCYSITPKREAKTPHPMIFWISVTQGWSNVLKLFIILTVTHRHGTERATPSYTPEGEARMAGCRPFDSDRGSRSGARPQTLYYINLSLELERQAVTNAAAVYQLIMFVGTHSISLSLSVSLSVVLVQISSFSPCRERAFLRSIISH